MYYFLFEIKNKKAVTTSDNAHRDKKLRKTAFFTASV